MVSPSEADSALKADAGPHPPTPETHKPGREDAQFVHCNCTPPPLSSKRPWWCVWWRPPPAHAGPRTRGRGGRAGARPPQAHGGGGRRPCARAPHARRTLQRRWWWGGRPEAVAGATPSSRPAEPPSVPIQSLSETKTLCIGHLYPLCTTPDFQSKELLGWAFSTEASEKSSYYCAAQQFLSGTRHGRGAMTPSHWASSMSGLAAGPC